LIAGEEFEGGGHDDDDDENNNFQYVIDYNKDMIDVSRQDQVLLLTPLSRDT
jgi:hypothetical protein